MKIAIVAPSSVPFVVGGAEKLWWGLLAAINQGTAHDAELIKLPSPERNFIEVVHSYRAFSQLQLDHFDLVITTKYPAWMLSHPNHLCYLQHRLRGLYDRYPRQLPPGVLAASLGTMPRGLRRFVLTLEDAPRPRTALPDFFDELLHWSGQPALAEHFSFPGPLTRAVIHYLDGIALAPAAIQRYCAISHNVAQRPDYFPAGVDVGVIHHPSDLSGLHCAAYQHVFTASRLTRAKRIDLIIRAFRMLDAPVELRIAGTGPERDQLVASAAGDPRIRFLGHINDAQMVSEFAHACFVPFVPDDEDYGLITVEAMASSKPVLTTSDAGGVNELVEDGVNGRVVAAEPAALAAAMRDLLADPQQLRAMGARARARVAAIQWPHTVAALLASPDRARRAPARRPRVVVAVDFPIDPPRGGGQARVYHLYRALARRADCHLITLCNAPGDAGDFTLAPGLREQRIAKSSAHRDAARALGEQLGASVDDIATLLHGALTPDYRAALTAAAADADVLIASHPYLYPLLRECGARRLWYDAHNVEFDMKTAVLGDGAAAQPYLAQVRATEAALCAAAEVVLVCAERDAHRFQDLYGLDPRRGRLVPNGVDTRMVPFVDPVRRAANRRKLGLQRPTLLFIGSWHQPNLAVLATLRDLAVQRPDCDLLVVGSVGRHALLASPPPNLRALGVLPEAELEVLLGAVDIALNPMTSGSGTNLKMLHYAAAGVPILTSPFGARGLALASPTHLWSSAPEQFAETVGVILAAAPDEREARVRAARAVTERQYDWRVIAAALPLAGAAD